MKQKLQDKARASEALQPLEAMPPNDQELSHAELGVNRGAELPTPTALAPVMC